METPPNKQQTRKDAWGLTVSKTTMKSDATVNAMTKAKMEGIKGLITVLRHTGEKRIRVTLYFGHRYDFTAVVTSSEACKRGGRQKKTCASTGMYAGKRKIQLDCAHAHLLNGGTNSSTYQQMAPVI